MKDTKTGFSLIEALITITLISIIAVVALSFTVYCYKSALQADTRIVAANFARETMESLYKKDYAGLVAQDHSYDDSLPTGDGVFGSSFRDHHGGTRTYTITNMGDYKLITVTVTWDQ